MMSDPESLAEMTVVGPVDYKISGINIYGVILLAATVFIVLLYLIYCLIFKWTSRRGKISTLNAARIRLAAARGDISVLQELRFRLGDDFDPNSDDNGFTALAAAAAQKQPAAVLWLCHHGADVAAMKDDGWKDTALHYAAAQGCLESVKVLLTFGASQTACNFAGETPRDLAIANNHPALMQLLNKKELVLPKSEYEGKIYVIQSGKWCLVDESTVQFLRPHESFFQRAWEGAGSPGTAIKSTVPVFRVLAILSQFCGAVYIIWRALRTLRPGLGYIYSITFWLAECASFLLGNIFILSLWNQIERPERLLQNMMTWGDEFPAVDVFIPCYFEPIEVIEATAIAAANMDYPGKKLCIKILDDGKRSEVANMVRRLQKQAAYMGRESTIQYVTRKKVKGVAHHAKAGNINNCLLKTASTAEDAIFILVLDCDMIVAPSFLLKTIGHFYSFEQSTNQWVLKDLAALLQTPQDFWNVDASDPMVHCARFFYGPMLQGRDGAGACPCCGTGVVFRKDILLSLGGQAYGSITEDYNTAMQTLSCGFATMFLHQRLVYGMSPDDTQGVFQQRLRWSMGALQILFRDNPLQKSGLTFCQALLFWETASHYFLAISTVYMSVVPIVYLFTEYSPMVVNNLWEFCIVFCGFYMMNRIAMWWVHRGAEGGDQELWRGSQMWVWMAPNHIKAIIKVAIAELPLLKRLTEITFTVTSKEKTAKSSNIVKTLWVTWPFLLYIAAYFAGSIFFIVRAALDYYSSWQIVIFLTALAWGMLNILCIWPPVSTVLPRVETEEGWKIQWNPFFQTEEYSRDAQGRLVKSNQHSQASPPSSTSSPGLTDKLPPSVQSQPYTSRENSSGQDGSSGILGLSVSLGFADGLDIAFSPFDESDNSEEEINEEDGNNDDKSPKEKQVKFTFSQHLPSTNAIQIVQLRDPSIRQMPNQRSPIPSASVLPFSIEPDTLYSSRRQQSQYMSNVGRVNLPHRTAQALATSAFLTSMVLPEPNFHQSSQNLNAVGGSPVGGSPLGARMVSFSSFRSSYQFSSTNLGPLPARSVLFSDLEMIPDEGSEGESAVEAMEAGNHRLPQLSVEIIAELIGATTPVLGQSPQPSQHMTLQQRQEEAANRRLMSMNNAITSREAQLAAMASMNFQMQNHGHISLGANARMEALISTCATMAQPATFHANSSLLLPVLPSNIFDHTIAARPSFEHRQAPRRNFMFLCVNGLLLAGLIAGAILDVFVKTN